MKLKRAVVALSAAVMILSGTAQAVPRYSVTFLGFLNGHGPITSGINASGQVVGGYTQAPPSFSDRPFLSIGDTVYDFGTLGTHIMARAINDRGQIVGWFQHDPDPGGPGSTRGGYNAFLYSGHLSSGDVMTALGTINGSPIESGEDINASGQVAAWYHTASGKQRAVLYSGGVGTDLGTLVGDDSSSAAAINDSGQVVGTSRASDGTDHAFLYSGGAMTDLGTLGGNFNSSRATDINDSGQVVGTSSTPDGRTHTFLYSGGAMTDLGVFGSWGLPKINNSGQILSGGSLYSDGIRTSLDDLIDPQSGWRIFHAGDINDAGQIAATGSGLVLLLSPVPEPEIYLMMLAGLGLVSMKMRRRNSIQP